MKKYEWNILISGSVMHPIEIYRGSFIYMDGREKNYRSLGAGSSMYTSYWSSPGGTMNHADAFPLPTELSIAWFSYTEAKFYGGNFELPYEKIVELFKNEELKTIRQEKLYKEKYRSIRIGLAPGGLISIWATGSGYLKEIAYFQANELQVSMDEFRPSRANETIIEFAKSRMINAPYAVYYLNDHSMESEKALFKRYLERYSTGFKVNFEDHSKNQISCFNVQFANGERLPFFPEDKVFSERGDYGSMKYFELDWYHTDYYGKRSPLQANVCIKKEEFLRIYEQAWGPEHNKAINIIVNIAKDNKGIEIYLTDGVSRFDFDMEFVQTEIWNTNTDEILHRSLNYILKEEVFTWDNYSD